MNKHERRALRLLSTMEAVEAVGRPLRILEGLRFHGLAEIVGSRIENGERQNLTALTSAGRDALAKESGHE